MPKSIKRKNDSSDADKCKRKPTKNVDDSGNECEKLPAKKALEMEGPLSEEDDEHDGDEINHPDDSGDLHFKHVLSPEFASNYSCDALKCTKVQFPLLGKLRIETPVIDENHSSHVITSKSSLNDFCLKENVLRGCQESKLLKCPKKLSPFQFELFSVISKYVDFQYNERTHLNGEDIRLVYCIHVLNHVLKTRARVIHHNYKLSKNREVEYRDQGFTRPTVLILAPFKESCNRIVKMLISLLGKCDVLNKKRFLMEFGSDKDMKRKTSKPDDFVATFAGNKKEDFKIGLRIKNKSLCLYSDFYSADVIIASPLGLVRRIGAEGDRDRDYDFLSSIEIFILDQANVLLMQNWMHVVHVAQQLNLRPTESHGCDFSRIHMYALEEWTKFYRQTILFSDIESEYFNTVFRMFCFNYGGYVSKREIVQVPSINLVLPSVPQAFHRFDATDLISDPKERLEFFLSKVLPDFKDPHMSQTLIFIPSYFDFICLRNHFRTVGISSTMLCEYTDSGKVAQGRSYFCHGFRHFMLYTERLHFYNRYSIKGVKHIIFFQPPTNPVFYNEVCNFLLNINPKKINSSDQTCTTIFSKHDELQLKHVVGTKKARRMLMSEESTFMLRE